jgi:hypothetical protein
MAQEFLGEVVFKDAYGKVVMRIDPHTRRFNIYTPEGDIVAYIGAVEAMVPAFYVSKGAGEEIKVVHRLNNDGVLKLGNQEGMHSLKRHKIILDGQEGQCWLGGYGANGHLGVLYGNGNPETNPKAGITLLAGDASVRVGGAGVGGTVLVYDADANNNNLMGAKDATIHLWGQAARARVGGSGKDGSVHVCNGTGQTLINLDGKTGDITLTNADCAEEFDVEEGGVEPGSVLVLSDEPGRLRLSDTPYDTRVAGVLSGAGDYRPAIVLDRQPEREGRRPVALVGKVWCRVEAESAPIGVGSLLTTSARPGHAMAATDRARAFGAVLGKALAPLAAGVGVVPVLVALQ